MKSIYLIIAVLVFSHIIIAQTGAKQSGWTVVVTDNLAAKKEVKTTAKKTVEKSSTPEKTEKSFLAVKPDESALMNQSQAAEEKPQTEKTPKTDDNTPAKKISDWEKTWSILARVSGSFDTNIEHDPVGVKAFGVVPSLTAGYQMRSPIHRFRFIYSFAAPRYTIDTDLNRFGNYFSAAYRYQIGKWSFETEGEVSLKGTNEDRETNDQYVFTETIGYRFDSKTRLNVYGAYRIRRFPSVDADRNASNPMLGLKFSREINKKIDWNVGYRYDENRAVGARQDYIRSTYRTGFDIQLTKNDLLETEVSYRPRRYNSRLVEIGDAEVLRRDKKWSFDAVWKHNFAPRWGFEAGYQFEKQNSNDLDKIYRNHQMVFSVFYHWGNGDVIAP